MKTKLLLVAILGLFSISSYGQRKVVLEITSTDTMYIEYTSSLTSKILYWGQRALDEYEVYKSKNKGKSNRWRWDGSHWQGVGITYSGLVSNLGNLYKPAEASWMTQGTSSIGVDVNFVDLTLFSSGCFGIFTGLGLEINNFRFDKNVTLGNDVNGYVVPDWSYSDAGIQVKSSKLTTTYIQVPLMVEFRFGYKNRIWINGGVVAGFLVDAHTKVVTAEYGKQKRYRDLNLNNFHYGFEVAAGYSVFGLRAKYYPQSIFRKGEGPDVRQVSIGLTIAL